MKILQIRLIAFGPFTDLVLDLSHGDGCGLHVIHGPNEAGKSASLRALTALFYGIPVRTSDNFLHDNQGLRLGASIGNRHGEELTFLRRKGSKDTLLDESGKPLPDSVLAEYLGGAGEDLFRTMFGLDHETLVRGGEQILQGGGAIGESLFAAGMGGTNLHEVKRGLEEEAQKLFLPRGRSQSITLLANAYNEARQKSVQASLSSREWVEHDTALREAAAQKEKVTAELGKLESEKNRLERFRKVLPLLGERRELIERLNGLGKVRDLSPSFGKKRREAIQRMETARDMEKSASEAIQRIGGRIEALVIPEALLQRSDTVMGLHERLGSHRKAHRDLQRLLGELIQLEADAEAAIKELRPDISMRDVEALRISAAARVRIRELGNRHQTLVDRVARCTRDVEGHGARLASRKAASINMKPPRNIGKLKTAAMRAQKQGDLEEELRKGLAGCDAARGQIDVEVRKLRLWSGPAEEIESLPVPSPETIDRFDSALNSLDRRLQGIVDRLRQAEERKTDLDGKMNELRLGGQVPTEADLEAARGRRSHGWSLVRRAWLEGDEISEEAASFDSESPLPDAFEKSIRESDQVADRLRREADRVAAQAAFIAQHKKCLEEIEEHGKQEAGARLEMDRLMLEWADLWRPMGIAPLTPKEMRSWAAKHDRLAQLAARLRAEQGRIDLLRSGIEGHRAALGDCLSELDESAPPPGESLDALINRSLGLIADVEEEARRRKVLREEIAKLENDVQTAVRERDRAASELIEWQGKWAEAVTSLGVSPSASAGEASAVLDRVEDLFKKVDKMAGITGRVKGIQRDADEFEHDVKSLCQAIATDLLAGPVEQAVPELGLRLQKANKDAAALAQLQEQIKENEASIQQARATIQRSELQLKELCREAGCSIFDELEEMEERSARAQAVRKDLEGLERQLLSHGAGATIEELTGEGGQIDADSLPARIEELTERVEALEKQKSELLERIGREKSLLHLMDGRAEAAEAAEKAQSIVARIREDTHRYVSLRLASAVLHREIERYRSENQDPVLRRTSELFSRLTLGSFAALRTDYNESDEPILLGARPGEELVRVQGMSEGTRDQLYLALRIASLERYLRHNEPMPLILDDILINFDDGRSNATLQVLEDLSHQTQVVFFTHHAHLVDLARKSVSEAVLRTHFLPPCAAKVGG